MQIIFGCRRRPQPSGLAKSDIPAALGPAPGSSQNSVELVHGMVTGVHCEHVHVIPVIFSVLLPS